MEEESHWADLAQKHWSKPVKTRKVKSEVIRIELWDALEKEAFNSRSFLVLESLQLLEKYAVVRTCQHFHTKVSSYLWPGYTEDSTNHHVLLIALVSTAKSRERLPVWGACCKSLALANPH